MNQTAQPQRFLCFRLGAEEFAIPLLVVREVLGVPEITPVPQAQPHFLGIMNLRGQVISVMDLRLKLGVKAAGGDETAVIILDLGAHRVGMVVDRVDSVQQIQPNEETEKPALENSKAGDYVVGVFRREDRLILVLDVARALSLEEKAMISKTGSKVA